MELPSNGMSTADIKRTLEELTPDERFFAASYLTVLMHRDDLEYGTLLAERMDRMDAGQKVSLDEALRAHNDLESKGL